MRDRQCVCPERDGRLFKMDKAKLHDSIKNELQTLNSSVESALRRVLSTPCDLGHSGKLQFEIDPLYYRIHLIQTEEDVLESYTPKEDIEVVAEENDLDIYEIISDEIVSWFAKRWQAVNGPSYYSPAYLFFHGEFDAHCYDLEKCCWYRVQEVWPELHKKWPSATR